jgi:hypothetical protein
MRISIIALCCAAVLALIAAGCIPARLPENLSNTPGAAVMITDRVFEAPTFTVRYPGGWRIVTGPAAFPAAVVFVAPDEKSTIKLQVGELNQVNLDDGKTRTEVRAVTLTNGIKLTAVASAPPEQWAAFLPLFEAVLASLKAT